MLRCEDGFWGKFPILKFCNCRVPSVQNRYIRSSPPDRPSEYQTESIQPFSQAMGSKERSQVFVWRSNLRRFSKSELPAVCQCVSSSFRLVAHSRSNPLPKLVCRRCYIERTFPRLSMKRRHEGAGRELVNRTSKCKARTKRDGSISRLSHCKPTMFEQFLSIIPLVISKLPILTSSKNSDHSIPNVILSNSTTLAVTSCS